MNGAGELGLLAGEVSVRVVGELLAKDKNTVQRRTQFVRHIGQEFGLVFRSQRKLRCLLFERMACLFDFLVLSFDFDVAFGELLGLLFELLVGLLQFTFCVCSSPASCCDCLEQTFSLHRRFDGVEHDADAGDQLLEEHRLQRGELGDQTSSITALT